MLYHGGQQNVRMQLSHKILTIEYIRLQGSIRRTMRSAEKHCASTGRETDIDEVCN